MNKKLMVGGAVLLAIAAFAVGRYTSQPRAAARAGSKKVLYYVDPMHPSYRSDKPGTAPDCGMALEPVYEGQDSSGKLDLPAGAISISAERQQLYGIRVETAKKRSGPYVARTTGRVQAEDNRVYRMQAATEGWVQSLEDNPVGTVVKKNQLLATLYSKEFRNAEQAYIASLVSLDRLKPNRDIDDATRMNDGNLRINEEQLRSLGMGEPQIKELAKSRQITRDITLNSPIDGVVISRDISQLQRFDRGAEFYRIADLSKVWIVADIYGDEQGLHRPGAKVRVNLRETGKTLTATVSENLPAFDPSTRTLKLRLEADNPTLLLRPDMFVDLEFNVNAPAGISLPQEAVLDTGLGKTVYVESAEGVFEPRAVTLGSAFGEQVLVTRGLSEGERFVASGNFLVDSESRLRAAPVHATESAASSPNVASHEASALKDPVCGMALSSAQIQSGAHVEKYRGDSYHFCSDKCQDKFRKDPAHFASSNAAANAVPDESREARR